MQAHVKQVLSPDVPVPVTLQDCYAAWVAARRGKKPSANLLAFASRWLSQLQSLHHDLRAGMWMPRRTVSFVVKHPKTREIHAPDFADRVVHHLLVPQLERLWEPIFICDSYANRVGKGSHAAVDRLQAFMRQRNGCGWFLQLDIHNFFNTIHRPTLYALLKQRIAQHMQPARKPAGVASARPRLTTGQAQALQSLCHKLLAYPVRVAVRDPHAAQRVPPHKRLVHAQPGCGVPIGNLSSQFFANVYLNELDQFVKHRLKVRHYVRYVDDFVLLADDPAQLEHWQAEIEKFLAQRLRLKLKTPCTRAPLAQGIDFLGYVVWATHRLVRRRVVAHCQDKLQAWQQRHVQTQTHGDGAAVFYRIRAQPEHLAQLQHLLASYWGHFAHARTVRLRHALLTRFAWLRALFHISPAAHLTPRWVLQGTTFAQQVADMRAQWPHAVCSVQKGCETLRFAPLQAPDGSCVHAQQTGWLRHGTRRREITQFSVRSAVVSAL